MTGLTVNIPHSLINFLLNHIRCLTLWINNSILTVIERDRQTDRDSETDRDRETERERQRGGRVTKVKSYFTFQESMNSF